MDTSRLTLGGIVLRTVVVHTATYMLVGALAFTAFDYPTLFAQPGLRDLFRPTTDPMVAAGPLFQPIRGVLFGVVFYLLRDPFLGTKHGWVTMWIVLVVVGILSTFGPAPSSVEGLIYTTIPLRFQFSVGVLEVLAQSLLLSWGVFSWVSHPERRWLIWALGIVFVFALVGPALALLSG